MKIVLGANTFGEYKRQDIAVESWRVLSKEFNVDVYDIQFEDECKTFTNPYNLKPLFNLQRSSRDVLDTDRKLPFVNDIISCISEIDSDYFIFTNSDIIINGNLIKYIRENKPTCFACSRLDIMDISSFDDLRDNIHPVRWEPAGFDTFVFKREWYMGSNSTSTPNRELFRDYFLGQPEWDAVYAGIMKLYGNNDPIGNIYPPYCFHIKHDIQWNKPSLEREFNVSGVRSHAHDSLIHSIMDYHLHSNLIKRKPYGAFLNIPSNEKEIEQKYFDKFLIK